MHPLLRKAVATSRLGDVLPRQPQRSTPDGCRSDLEVLSQGDEGPSVHLVQLSNGADNLRRQPGIPVRFAPRYSLRMCAAGMALTSSHTALRCGVGHVLSGSTEEQMGGVDTAPVVTAMADQQVCGQMSIGEQIGCAMRPDGLPLDVKDTVAIAQDGTVPQPTFTGTAALHLGPEQISSRGSGVHSAWHSEFLSGCPRPRWFQPRGGTSVPRLYLVGGVA